MITITRMIAKKAPNSPFVPLFSMSLEDWDSGYYLPGVSGTVAVRGTSNDSGVRSRYSRRPSSSGACVSDYGSLCGCRCAFTVGCFLLLDEAYDHVDDQYGDGHDC